MKKFIIIGLIVLVGGAFIYSIFFTKEEFEGEYAKFNFIQDNLALHIGETVDLKIDVAYDEVTEIELLFNDKVLKSWKSPKGQLVYSFEGTDELMGTHGITVRAIAQEGTTRDDRLLRVLSDITPEIAKAEIIAEFPHDPTSYTQGLEFYKGKLYEGTGDPGRQGKTMLGEIDPATGSHIVGRRVGLPAKYFGEGITILNDKVYQLTWQNNTCFVYDVNNFMGRVDEFEYVGEGWGLCNDGKSLIMSDGSERITFRDTNDFSVQREIEVYNDEGPVSALNELEYINGLIYANVYTQNWIIVIDPKTGKVVQQISANKLAEKYGENADVLNGIAYNPSTQKMIVTGKFWTKYLEVEVIPVK
ncbi:MAG: glutaminyl-peptide cyclotransferase [Crocinitomicaceae bacterium]|nr:glutaminyl-peptide cyclotransferase [Crocinitomicaceae bacterium]